MAYGAYIPGQPSYGAQKSRSRWLLVRGYSRRNKREQVAQLEKVQLHYSCRPLGVLETCVGSLHTEDELYHAFFAEWEQECGGQTEGEFEMSLRAAPISRPPTLL